MRQYLPCGYKLNSGNRCYTILDRIGEGASSIAYKASRDDGSVVVIKEYYPNYLKADRDSITGVILSSQQSREKYEAGKEAFSKAIELQIKIRNGRGGIPNNQAYQVIDRVAANGTLYCIMSLFDGDVYTHNETIGLYNRLRICNSVACYVRKCHEMGYVCLDIKPDNIFYITDTPELALFFDYDSLKKLDEVQKEGTISFSSRWAAPELKNPSSYEKISYKTDIFLLGELIFWSVFNRNSFFEEHSIYSIYPYKDAYEKDCLTEPAKRVLTTIFHNSLAAAPDNRYSSVVELLSDIGALLGELNPNRHRLVTEIKHNHELRYFIGRQSELANIDEALKSHRVCCVYGARGIGKSELLHRYIFDKYDNYSKILFFDCSGGLIDSVNKKDFINGFEEWASEDKNDLCLRKLKNLRELSDENTLIVCDDVTPDNLEVSENNAWETILSIQGKILYSSRRMPDSQVGSVVQIGEMSETELVEIYKEKSGISELLKTEREEIIKIIKAVSSHTMLLILLARLANQKGFTPSEMTRLLTENGLFSLNWFVSIENRNVAIMDYLGSVIDVEKLTKSEALCLLLMAVMPDEGVRKKVFLESFIHVHASDVDHLLSLGLISEQGNDSTINISNLVREVIIGKEEGNGSLFEEMGEELVEGIFLWSTHQDYQIEYMMSLAEIISGNVIRLSINSRSLVGFVWTTFFASLGHSINYEPGKSIAYLKKFYDNKQHVIEKKEYIFFEYAKLLEMLSIGINEQNAKEIMKKSKLSIQVHEEKGDYIFASYYVFLIMLALFSRSISTPTKLFQLLEFLRKSAEYKQKANQMNVDLYMSALSNFCDFEDLASLITIEEAIVLSPYLMTALYSEMLEQGISIKKAMNHSIFRYKVVTQMRRVENDPLSLRICNTLNYFSMHNESMILINDNDYYGALNRINAWIRNSKLNKDDFQVLNARLLRAKCLIELGMYQQAYIEFSYCTSTSYKVKEAMDIYSGVEYLFVSAMMGVETSVTEICGSLEDVINGKNGSVMSVARCVVNWAYAAMEYKRGNVGNTDMYLSQAFSSLEELKYPSILAKKYAAHCHILKGDIEFSREKTDAAYKNYHKAKKYLAAVYRKGHPKIRECAEKMRIIKNI